MQTFIATLIVEAPDRQKVLDILRTMNQLGAKDFHLRSVLSVDLMTGDGEEQVYLVFPRQRHEPGKGHFIEVIKVVKEPTGFGLKTTKEMVEAGRVGPMTRIKAEELRETLQEILGQTVQIVSVR